MPSHLFLLHSQWSTAVLTPLKFSLRHEPFTCSIRLAFSEAGIAQLVEQLICNQQVVGSNPSAGSRDGVV